MTKTRLTNRQLLDYFINEKKTEFDSEKVFQLTFRYQYALMLIELMSKAIEDMTDNDYIQAEFETPSPHTKRVSLESIKKQLR